MERGQDHFLFGKRTIWSVGNPMTDHAIGAPMAKPTMVQELSEKQVPLPVRFVVHRCAAPRIRIIRVIPHLAGWGREEIQAGTSLPFPRWIADARAIRTYSPKRAVELGLARPP